MSLPYYNKLRIVDTKISNRIGGSVRDPNIRWSVVFILKIRALDGLGPKREDLQKVEKDYRRRGEHHWAPVMGSCERRGVEGETTDTNQLKGKVKLQ